MTPPPDPCPTGPKPPSFEDLAPPQPQKILCSQPPHQIWRALETVRLVISYAAISLLCGAPRLPPAQRDGGGERAAAVLRLSPQHGPRIGGDRKQPQKSYSSRAPAAQIPAAERQSCPKKSQTGKSQNLRIRPPPTPHHPLGIAAEVWSTTRRVATISACHQIPRTHLAVDIAGLWSLSPLHSTRSLRHPPEVPFVLKTKQTP